MSRLLAFHSRYKVKYNDIPGIGLVFRDRYCPSTESAKMDVIQRDASQSDKENDLKMTKRTSENLPMAVGKEKTIPVVGIGASAGGLEALKEFFAAMPADSGMAFVVIQHLDPQHESRMAEILAKCTSMKVVQAEDGMAVGPNTVFTNPPGRSLSIRGGRLVLGMPPERRHVEAAIDQFLISLAEDQGEERSLHHPVRQQRGGWPAGRAGGSRRRRDVHGAGPEDRAIPGDAAGGDRYRPGGPCPAGSPDAGGAAGLCAA